MNAPVSAIPPAAPPPGLPAAPAAGHAVPKAEFDARPLWLLAAVALAGLPRR